MLMEYKFMTFGLENLFIFGIFSYSCARNGLLKGYTKKSPQWTFLCREPSVKKRI